jgi:ATP-binding cassette subfamily C protein
MIANIYGECEKLTHLVIIPFTVLASEITIILFLLGLLLWSSPHITIYAFITFSIVYIIFNEATKKYIKKISHDRQSADYQKISEIDKSLSQIIEVKLYNAVRSRVVSYENFACISGNSNAMNGVLSGLPRIFMETLVVFIIISYCVYKIGFKNISIIDIVPEITMFSIIGYRLLPSLNRISNAKSNLQYSNVILSNLYNELYSSKSINTGKITNLIDAKTKARPILKFRDLKLKYGYAGHINYDMNIGDIVCINGPSGTGKTTFLYTIMGFLAPDNGTIDFYDTNIHHNLDCYRTYISYLPQNVVIRDASLYENITFEHNLTSIPINKKYEEVGLISNIDWVDNLYSQSNIGSVSAGQAQRIGIARALYHKKKILILDEPTSALDKQNATGILQEIIKRSSDCILIVVTHDEELKKLCNRFLNLE